MDIESSLNKLFSLHTFGIKLGLENTVNFLKHIGDPQKELKTIHIAGSNGKGSTSSFVASILMEMGLKIGLYTSPHFVKFNERVVVNGKQIDDQYICKFITENEKYIDEYQLTFFEVTTSIAFKYFRDLKTDYCVIETGLGGRLDSTNVLNPLAVIITTISLEHTNVLGNTIEQITSEKAAIIKNNSKVFVGFLGNEAMNVVERKCNETKSELYKLRDFFSETDEQVSLLLCENEQIEISPPVKGKFQKHNTSLAVLTVDKTFSLFDKRNYLKGINNVFKNTGLSGRYEYFNIEPTIIFDSAHNPEGVQNFLSEFTKEEVFYRKKFLIFGAMKDKAIIEMLDMVSSHFDEVLISEIKYERAAKPEEIVELCKRLGIKCSLVEKPAKYITSFLMGAKDECLVVLGSMYLLGDIKQQLAKL